MTCIYPPIIKLYPIDNNDIPTYIFIPHNHEKNASSAEKKKYTSYMLPKYLMTKNINLRVINVSVYILEGNT